MFAVSVLIAAVLMEPYSAAVHKLLWHGPLWRLHRHHHRSATNRSLNPNDLLSVSHAPIAVALCAGGFFSHGPWSAVLLGAGVGMTLYGALYMLFHDGMVHERLPVSFLLRFAICRRWKAAHERHHTSVASPWGFFLSPVLTAGMT